MRGVIRQYGKHIVLFAISVVAALTLIATPVFAFANRIDADGMFANPSKLQGHKLTHALKNAGKMSGVLAVTTEESPPVDPPIGFVTGPKKYTSDESKKSDDSKDEDIHTYPEPTGTKPDPVPVPVPDPNPEPKPIPYPRPCGGCPGGPITLYRTDIYCPMQQTTNYICAEPLSI